MTLLQKLLLLITLTFYWVHEAWSMDPEQQKKSLCLMAHSVEYTSEEWLPEYEKYLIQKGRQQQRLEGEKEHTRSYVRYVKDISSLTVGYGLLTKDKKAEIPKLELNEKVYQELAEIGTAVKIINGYINGYGVDDTFTPNATNVFVPHISYVIQWQENTLPELVPGGMLHDQDGSSIVFMSGADNNTVELFYNNIYTGAKEDKISIYSGKKIAEKYVPCILFDAVKTLDIFNDISLSKLSEEMTNIFPYINDENDKSTPNKKAVHCAFQFLKSLFSKDFACLFKSRQDTVRALIQNLPPTTKVEIREEEVDGKKTFNENAFIEALKNNRSHFLQAALKRIKEKLLSLEDGANNNIAKVIVKYIKYSLFIKTSENLIKSKKLWEIIKELNAPLKLAKYFLSATEARRMSNKALEEKNYNYDYGSHTEPLFIKMMRAEPQLLTQGFQKITGHKEKITNDEKPKLLGIVIDSFSWLDTCEKCGKYLHENKIWNEALKELNSMQELTNCFTLPLSQIDSLFRVVAQEQYGGPSDISKAEGGKEYTVSGWDYRFLSENRYTLATRRSGVENLNDMNYTRSIRASAQQTQLQRDKIFESIPTAMTRTALNQPIKFWLDYYAHWPLTQMRPFADNIIQILVLRFPDENVVKIRAIEIEKNNSNYENVYHLVKPFVENPLEFTKDDKELLRLIIPDSNIVSMNYLKTYFAEACLKKVKYCFQLKDAEKGWKYLNELVQIGFLFNNKEDIVQISPNEVAQHCIAYWENKYIKDRRLSNNSPLVKKEKETVVKTIELLWKLAYKQEEYETSLNDKEVTELQNILEESQLEKPNFASKAL